MNAADAIEMLKKVDPESEVFIQQGEDAYPMTIRVFQRGHGRKNRTAFGCLDVGNAEGNHQNFPENYAGVRELLPLGEGKKKEDS